MTGPGPVDRRQFLVGGGTALVCTLAGKELFLNQPADLPRLAHDVPVPPKVTKAERNGAVPARSSSVLAASGGRRREYWIRAEPVRWNIVPTRRDQMMARRIKVKHRFLAYAYRPYTPGFGAPVGPASIPGPLIEAEVGDTVVVNFQNALPVPVTIHPHGIFYSSEMDGAYKGRFTDPGGFVQKGRTFQYIWDARPGTEGTWLYHDHGPMDPVPLYKGLFGPLIIREPGAPRADSEFFVAMHSFQPIATGLRNAFGCINGRAYAGNTPTLRSRVGDRVAFNVYAIDNDFHTFHLHGHRWPDADGTILDNRTLGPADSYHFEFVEDNPGRWFYHCHVFSHLHMGMNGWYVVS